MPIVRAIHPAVVRFQARGGSVDRVHFAAQATPVDVRHVDPRDVEPVRERPASVSFAAHEGALWYRPALDGTPAGPGDLVAWLEGTLEPCRDNQLDFALTRTPLMAASWGKRGSDAGIGPARVLEDQAPRAAAAVAAYVDANVRICGDGVLVRARGPVTWFDKAGAGLACFPQYHDAVRRAVRPELAADLWGFETRPGGLHPQGATMPSTHVHDFPASMVGDADLHIYANMVPGAAIPTLNAWGQATRGFSRETYVELVGAAAALGTAYVDGFMGMVDPQDSEAVLVRVRDALRLASAAWVDSRIQGRRWTRGVDERDALDHAAFIDHVALPRLRARPDLAEDDHLALNGLSP